MSRSPHDGPVTVSIRWGIIPDGVEVQEHPDGTRMWFLNGRLHRTDGPAIERADGTVEWWFRSCFMGANNPFDGHGPMP
jgi:hypothetical protein